MTDLADLAAALLARAKPFSSLSEPTRQRLAAHATELLVTPGDVVIREGDIGRAFYVVAAGELHVLGRAFDGSELVLDRVGPGTCFGEQSLLDEQPLTRSASIRAVTRCRLIELPREALREAGDLDPALIARLRQTGVGQKAERDTLFRERILANLGIDGGYVVQQFARDSFVFRQGDPGEKIYLVTSGRAVVLRGSGDDEAILSELLPGQFFGELAIVNAAPRGASVRAADDLEVVSLDGTWFRGLLERNPKLSSIVASLKAMYVMPARGLVTLQSSGLGSRPSLTSLHHLADGRKVLSIRHTSAEAFRGMVVGADEATFSVRYTNRDTRIQRQLHMIERRVVEIEAEGPWPGLGAAFEAMLDGTPLSDGEIDAFEIDGDLGHCEPPPRDSLEVVCRCSGVTAAAIVTAIASGCRTLDDVATTTRATVVCGGCIPTVSELLGQDDWIAATCERKDILRPDIGAFRLRTTGPPRQASPGQHVVLQARIRGRWVSRPYTLVSDPASHGTYDLIVRREADGLLSPWLFDQLQDGGALRVSPPRGDLCIGNDVRHPVIFLVGGIGITPALSAARCLDARPGWKALVIDHSVATPDEAICRAELEDFARRDPRLTFRLRITRDQGRIRSADVEGYAARFPDALFWICGSDKYVTGVSALLQQGGVLASQVAMERFTPWG